MAEDKQLSKIAAILNKAENTDNDEERDAFLSAATRLSVKHGIDLDIARRHTNDKRSEAENNVIVKKIDIGEKREYRKSREVYGDLIIAIAESQDLPWRIAQNRTFVQLVGPKLTIDLIEDLFAVLVTHMIADVNEFLSKSEWRTQDARWDARKSFCVSFSYAIKQRLIEARLEAESDAERDYGQDAALVLADKRSETRSLYAQEFGGQRGTYRGRWQGNNSAGHAAGRKSAANANIHNRESIGARDRIER